jgi:hypothetical protein
MVERLRITSGGIIQISQASPQVQFIDSDGTNQITQVLQSGNAFYIDLRDNTNDGQLIIRGKGGDTATERLRIASDGVITNTLATDNTTAVTLRNNGITGGHVLKLTTGGTGAGTNIFSVFRNNQSSEAEVFRINGSGTVFVDATFNTTADNARKSYFTNTGQQVHGRNAHETYIVFQDVSNNQIGGIVRGAGSSIAFNTTSDYRLKENVVTLSDAITRLKTLSPKRFNFKSAPSITLDGFLAHEVTAVPEAVEGEKDGVITQAMLDAGTLEGTVGDPIYQGIDQSKLVPLLTAALQEAVAKIETLETKVAALEG